jgi:hypothetical protein
VERMHNLYKKNRVRGYTTSIKKIGGRGYTTSIKKVGGEDAQPL